MNRRTKLMGHMAVDPMAVTDQIEMIQSKMANCWTLWRGEGIDIGMTLVLIQISTMIVTVIILTRGVIGDTFQMSLRKEIHLLLMEM